MKVSVVIPTWNGEAVLVECLEGVFRQEVDFEFEVLVIDSGSSDRTLEIARRHPLTVHSIPQEEFNHGDTRNLGALLTSGELICFLVQDAYPERADWLATLVKNFDDPSVAGAHCRVLPRPDAGPLVLRGVERDINFRPDRLETVIEDPEAFLRQTPYERRLFINFNDVASCLRRSIWEQLPLPRVSFGEDMLWAQGALHAGHRIVFDPAATVVHSHEYQPRTLRQRTRVDGWMNRAYLDRVCIEKLSHVFRMSLSLFREDRRWLSRQELASGERRRLSLLALLYHFLGNLGAWQGGRTRDRLSSPVLVEDSALKILFVLHSFPPETTAGTEVLTAALARGLQRRGHHVTILCRSGDPGLERHALREELVDGLRVVRIGRALEYGWIRDTSHDESLDRPFADFLAREAPDVVHFEHLLHLSASLPRVCREAGIASVITLNDFWFRCGKVQLVRPDRSVCRSRPPVLGCAACFAGRPALIGPLALLSRPFGRLLAWLARRLRPETSAPRPGWRRGLADLGWLARRQGEMNRALLECDRILAPSRFLKAKMVEAGLPAERLVVSDYGMETGWLPSDRQRPADVSRRTVRFGFIGSLVWYKGPLVLARAFQRLAKEGVELHVHGDDRGRPEFEATRGEMERLVRRDGLFFHGAFDPARLLEVFDSIDVLVVPSIWYENSPLVIHEAFQAGVPVLVSDRGGMRDLVVDGHGGLRFRAEEDADLARVMARFLVEPELALQLVRQAPGVKSVADNAAEMEMRYRQVIGLHRGEIRAAGSDAHV